MAKEYDLRDDFELEGLWYSPKDKANRCVGRLTYDGKRCKLRLVGEGARLRRLTNPTECDPTDRVLIGILNNGSHATCLNYFDGATSFTSNGVSFGNLNPEELITGSCWFESNKIEFKKSRIRLDGLNERMDLPRISSDEAITTYPETISMAILSVSEKVELDGFSVHLTLTYRENPDGNSTTVSVSPCLIIEAEESREKAWFERTHWQLSCLFSFLADHRIDFKSIEYLAEPNGDPAETTLPTFCRRSIPAYSKAMTCITHANTNACTDRIRRGHSK